MVRDEDFDLVLKFKIEQYQLFLKNKVNPIDYGYKTYFFLRQNRLKAIKKPHDLKSIIFNYFYWVAKIERNITAERELAKYGVASVDKLNEINFRFIARRDQMVRRILYECVDQVKIESMKLIIHNIVEIKFEEFDFPFYVSQDVLERIKIDPPKDYSKSKYLKYLPYMSYHFHLDIN